MGTTASIRMHFSRERHARWAMHVAEEMLKLLYAPEDLPCPEQAEEGPPLSARWLRRREEAAAYPLDPRGTALEWLRRQRTWVCIDRCQDVARYDNVEDPEALFPQLCFAYALRFPHVPFEAFYRCEMTVSGDIRLIRMQYDGAVLHAQTNSGTRPMDEDDWRAVPVHDYAARDGEFRRI